MTKIFMNKNFFICGRQKIADSEALRSIPPADINSAIPRSEENILNFNFKKKRTDQELLSS